MSTPEDLAARKAAAQASLQAARDEQEALAAEADVLEEVVAIEREAAAEAALVKAQREHGRKSVARVETELGPFVVKKPHVAAFRKFQDSAEEAASEDCEQLVRPCVLYPGKEAFDDAMADKPGILIDLTNAVCRLAGVRKAELAGKR